VIPFEKPNGLARDASLSDPMTEVSHGTVAVGRLRERLV
jgi:hypothetical protein